MDGYEGDTRSGTRTGLVLAGVAWVPLLVTGYVVLNARRAAGNDVAGSCLDVCAGPSPSVVVLVVLAFLTLVSGGLALASLFRALEAIEAEPDAEIVSRAVLARRLDIAVFVLLVGAWLWAQPIIAGG